MRTYRNQPSGTVSSARDLRRNATDAEKRLWRALRDAFPTAKFRRQVPIGPYFADFFSFPAKLIIEADGGQHAEATSYDAARTRYLEAQGYRVLRFWNNDILENPEGVLIQISLSLPPLPAGEGRREGDRYHSSPSPSHAASRRGALPLPSGEGCQE